MKAVAVSILNITCRRKEKQRKKRQKKYKIYYGNDSEDDFNHDIHGGASESNE